MNTPEPPQGDPNEITFSHQLDIVANARTLDGLKELCDSLMAGRLTETIDLELQDSDQFRPSYNGDPHFMREPLQTIIEYNLEAVTKDPPSTKDITIKTDTNPDTPQIVTVQGYRRPGGRHDQNLGDPNSNKGTRLQMDYRLTENLEGREVHFDHGLIYLQTTSGELAYDAVMVLGEDGIVEDVLPPGDYHAERLYGSAIRDAEEATRNRNLPLEAIHHLDQLEGSLESTGTKLSHQRGENEYSALQADVAQLLGIDTDKLMSSKVDPKATFEANMNEPLITKRALKGTGEITVPKVIFQSEG